MENTAPQVYPDKENLTMLRKLKYICDIKF